MLHKSLIALAHIFLTSFVGTQAYAFYINFNEESMPVVMGLFVVLSSLIFYLAFRKADPVHYTYKHVLLLTAAYWLLSTLIMLSTFAFLNVFLIVGFFYYMIKENPTDTVQPEAA